MEKHKKEKFIKKVWICSVVNLVGGAYIYDGLTSKIFSHFMVYFTLISREKYLNFIRQRKTGNSRNESGVMNRYTHLITPAPRWFTSEALLRFLSRLRDISELSQSLIAST